MTARVGIGFTPFEDRLEVIEQATVLAERHGLAAVGVAESMTLAAPIVLARLVARTTRIRLMTGVLSVWSRTPATLALTAAELHRQSGGRFSLGLGASTAQLTEGLHGQPWRDPVEKLRSTVLAVRALLAGARLPAPPHGAYPLRLGNPPQSPIPIVLAAITTPSIKVAGELADEWLPFLLPPAGLLAGREQLAAVAAESGRPTPATVTASLPIALGPDRDSAARLAARWLTTYATRMGPIYPRVLRAHGYGPELDAVIEANHDPRDARLPAAAERLADDVLLFGTYDEVPDLQRRWLTYTDELSVVAPLGVPAEHIAETIEVIGAS